MSRSLVRLGMLRTVGICFSVSLSVRLGWVGVRWACGWILLGLGCCLFCVSVEFLLAITHVRLYALCFDRSVYSWNPLLFLSHRYRRLCRADYVDRWFEGSWESKRVCSLTFSGLCFHVAVYMRRRGYLTLVLDSCRILLGSTSHYLIQVRFLNHLVVTFPHFLITDYLSF